MKKIIIVMLVLMLTMPLLVMAGGQSDAEKQTTIAFCFQDLETEFWVAGHAGIVTALEDAGVKVIQKNANEDANRQLEQVKDSITQGVDGIIIIPQDGESAVTIAKEANKAGIPIGVFNRPPSDKSANAIVVVANNEVIAEASVEYMAEMARKLGRKVTPAIMVGDLGDPNAVGRKKGFYNVIDKYPELWASAPVEIPTKWDANVALANLQSAMQAHPDIDFLFTSSDFLFPVIKSVLAPLGKWKTSGDDDHVILGGLDGDKTAARLIGEGYVDATGVQDVFAEGEMILTALLKAIEDGEKTPNEWLYDKGFALTQGNYEARKNDMWGYKLLVAE